MSKNIPQNISRSATVKGKTIFAMVGPYIPNGHNRWPRGLLPISSTGTSRNGTAISHDIRPDKSICMLRWLFHKAGKMGQNWLTIGWFFPFWRKKSIDIWMYFSLFFSRISGRILANEGGLCNHKQCVFLRVFKLQVALILPRTTD